jgi:hypothetical protein
MNQWQLSHLNNTNPINFKKFLKKEYKTNSQILRGEKMSGYVSPIVKLLLNVELMEEYISQLAINGW